MISLDPSNLAEVLADVPRLGEAAGVAARAAAAPRGTRAAAGGGPRGPSRGRLGPRVLALEWLDPPFIGGHWVPEMIEIAGGADVLGVAGEKSRTAEWDEIAAADPDVIVAMPCGWDAAQARSEVEGHAGEVAAVGAERIWAVDAAASFSRPGPRLVEGTELLAHLLHPDRVDAPAGVPFEPVPAARAGGAALLGRERREMGLNWAEHTVEIDAPIETCFDAITDYETFPSWQGAVVDTEVLDWDEAGRGKRVRLFIDAKVRKVDYTLDYRYDEPDPDRVGLRRGQRHQRRRRPLPLRGPGGGPHPRDLQARPRGRESPCPGRSRGGPTSRR